MLGPFNKESQIEISEDVSRLGKPHQGLEVPMELGGFLSSQGPKIS